ncbi:sigma-54 interaction domain-containing protein [Candidatus Formimonas warabiya]|uniref:Transcriptional regulatory protein TyrR n=1 Tax=Formimonas warabiya TaxID=1761012 RepID=A0A3G1L0F4_FORW1|nr:sigma 54-interacting transcriptional regulator [Candidatus Formimonas warabiya]ATW28137.1 hypothetical protein DCMF_28315 [Candidatus Formimonas warabiya]
MGCQQKGDGNNLRITDFTSKAFIVLPSDGKLGEIQEKIIMEDGQKVIVTDKEKIVKVYSGWDLLKQMSLPAQRDRSLGALGGGEDFFLVDEESAPEDLCQVPETQVLVVTRNRRPVGVINDAGLFVKVLNYRPRPHHPAVDYQEIVECLEEEIFVTDEKGCICFLNPQAESICGVKAADVVGKHVTDLEREKIISSSISLEVIRAKKKVNILQKLKSGKTVLATGVPIFDTSGKMLRVLITSKDVQEINKLMEEIERKNTEIERKNKQFNALREGIFAQDNFVCRSPKMNNIKEMIKRIASTDMTVSIQGESGVGKEVVAKLIHNLSPRNSHSLVKINCGAIPENLLESELFGYESGAFTGASKGGKLGKIELAQQGTLFLDEIGEMPLLLQVKLLEFLQDREIIRVGGTKKIKVDTRVITATNRNLEQMVREGRFRQDLFYRLNVFPILVPPLRERREDIPALAEYFLERFNNKYQMHKRFVPEVIKAFSEYNWPGNVRELEHVVERATLVNYADTIGYENVCDNFNAGSVNESRVICTNLMPLKEAKKELETQLVQRAYEIYHSTYKAAKILQVDQSTIVRLLKKGK